METNNRLHVPHILIIKDGMTKEKTSNKLTGEALENDLQIEFQEHIYIFSKLK